MDLNLINLIQDNISEIDLNNSSITEIKKGKNSRIFKVIFNKQSFILKIYPHQDLLNRNRVKNEFEFLNLLEKGGFTNIPKVIRCNLEDKWMLMSYLDGKHISKVNILHYKKLFEFIVNIQSLRKSILCKKLANASEASFNLFDHYKSVKRRLEILSKNDFPSIIKNTKDIDSLNYLITNLYQNMTEIKKVSFTKVGQQALLKNVNLTQRVLSQSDIGFHNVFEDKNNNLLFFDFEYAGWDDSFKMISDIVLQPDYKIKNEFFYLLDGLLSNFIFSEKDIERLILTTMLYRIKWTCIILNPIFNDFSKGNCTGLEISKTIEKSIKYYYSTKDHLEKFKIYLSRYEF